MRCVDSRSDVYSLGAVVFEMLTGRVPFGGPDAMAMLTAHLNAPVPRVSETLADIPAWVDIAVSRALAKDPDERWATIADFGHALLAGDGGSTTVIRSGAGAGRPAGDLRSRRANRPRPARQRRLSRHPSRARPPGRDPAAAPRHPAQLGGRARAVHARGAGAPGGAPVDHPGARLRRRVGLRLSRHRLHRGPESARSHGRRRPDAVDASGARCSRSSSRRRACSIAARGCSAA